MATTIGPSKVRPPVVRLLAAGRETRTLGRLIAIAPWILGPYTGSNFWLAVSGGHWSSFQHPPSFLYSVASGQEIVGPTGDCQVKLKVSVSVHPQNVRFQNVRFPNVWFQNVRFQNVRFTKRQVYKTSGFKTSWFKTSSF